MSVYVHIFVYIHTHGSVAGYDGTDVEAPQLEICGVELFWAAGVFFL